MNGAKSGASRSRAGAGRGWASAVLLATLALSGCGGLGDLLGNVSGSRSGEVNGFIGGVVADEPEATLIGRKILVAGGRAADAAAAMGFAMAVTLPSRAGLGAGGACLVFEPGETGIGHGAPEALMFLTVAPATPGSADRPAGVPMLARGMFALQARYGNRRVESLVTPAEQLARFGVPASRAFVRDLAVVAGPLAADPVARDVFFIGGKPLGEGDSLLQPELAATLGQLRTAGVGDLYQGALAHRIEDGMSIVHGGLTVADLRAALPVAGPALTVPGQGTDMISTLPAPEAGGIATAGALQVLLKNAASIDAATARALGLATAWRKGGADAQALLAAEAPPAAIGALPASASFGAVDRFGQAVMCAVSMGNLFGTGRIVPGTGILLGAAPARLPRPLLAAAIAWNPNTHAFHAAAGGSGQDAAPVAAALGVLAGAAGQKPSGVPEPGRVNVLACPRYLPDGEASCAWTTDPRGAGLALGGL